MPWSSKYRATAHFGLSQALPTTAASNRRRLSRPRRRLRLHSAPVGEGSRNKVCSLGEPIKHARNASSVRHDCLERIAMSVPIPDSRESSPVPSKRLLPTICSPQHAGHSLMRTVLKGAAPPKLEIWPLLHQHVFAIRVRARCRVHKWTTRMYTNGAPPRFRWYPDAVR